MKRKITVPRLILLLLFIFVIAPATHAQVYQHNFGTTPITAHPYTAAPAVLNTNLSGSSWSNTTSAWTSFSGSAGQAISMANTASPAAITLSFNVVAGKQLEITSFNFWRQRSSSGAQAWAMSINGTAVGSGAFPTVGAPVGETNVTTPVTGLTGTVNVVLTLTGASGSGNVRIDDFTLNGAVTSTCTAPVITALSPASGPANTVVTLIGTGFNLGTGTSAVYFNGTPATAFTVVSDTQIKATVPATATTGPVSILTNSCEGVATNFTVLASNCATYTGPTDLFISEIYDAQAGDGGAVEFYNGTNATIDLSAYSLARYGDIGDATPSFIIPLSGMLAPGGIYIARTATTVCSLSGAPATTLTSGFNADDEFELIKNGVVIDNVHLPGDVGYTVIRNANAEVPQAVYNAADWTVSLNENCANLGIHSVNTAVTSQVTSQPASATACEGSSATFSVTISNTAGFNYQWKMLNASGAWVNVTNGGTYSGATTATLTISNAPVSLNNAQFYCQITSVACTLITNTAQLTVSPLPVVTSILVQPTCLLATGSITVVPVSGTGLTYSINGTTYQSGLLFSAITPGSYTLYVKTSANCIAEFPFTISTAIAGPAVATTTVMQPTCTVATGSITVTAPLALEYSINGGTTYQTGTTFTGLAPGTYTITTKNAAGCTSVTANITITAAPAGPAVATTTVTQPTCTLSTGSIMVTAPLALEYSIDGGTTYQTGTTFAGLAPGTYTITTKNAAGCTSVTANITITAAPAGPAVATTTVTQPTCTFSTGSITITAPLALEYSINGGTTYQTGTTFSGLAPGTYTITTKNAAGCTSVTANITITAAPAGPAVATTTVTQPTCTLSTGSITITAPLALEYSIDGGTTYQSGTTFAGLAPGTYIITTKNAAGCTSVTANITITAAPAGPAIATTTVTQPTCTLSTGSITITTPLALEYSINGGTTYQTGTTFAGLAPGTYTITTKNAAGCTSVTANITITAAPAGPAVATTTVTQPTCTVATGSITVTAPLGLEYSINGGTTYQTGTTFAGLASGTYTITTKNAAGCTSVTGNIVIDAAPQAPTSATLDVTQPVCGTQGTITVTAPVGTEYTYSINGTNFQAGVVFNGLAAGSYDITVKNGGGCTLTLFNIVINAASGNLQVAAAEGCEPTLDGNHYILHVLPENGSFNENEVTYIWKDENGLTVSTESSFDATEYARNAALDTNDYPLTFTVVVSTPGGCTGTASFTVNGTFCDIPKGVSPNGDTLNDNFDLTGMNASKVSIFNRYGQEVFARHNYTNQWHGQTDNNEDLPSGTYYYVVVAPNGTKTGWVYLNRENE